MIPGNFSLDPAALPGSLPGKLQQALAAGFGQIALWGSDLAAHPGGFDEAVQLVLGSGLRVTCLQVLRDYEGRKGALHEYKLDVAKATLKMCRAVRAPQLIVCSSTQGDPDCGAQRRAADLRKLANLAVPLGVRIGYKAVPWGHAVRTAADAWDVVTEVDHANFGLVLDSLHILMTGGDLGFLEIVDPQRIALLQLADFSECEVLGDPNLRAAANHGRVFPGDGGHSTQLAEIVRRIDRLGYRGDYGFLVMNDDYQHLPASVVTDHARRAVRWLTDAVLRRTLPLRAPLREAPPALG